MHKRGFTLIELLVVIAIVGILIALMAPLLSGCGDNSTQNNVVGMVKRVYEKSDTHFVAVELSDGTVETFQNTDNAFVGKYGSSTIQNMLDVGKTYRFRVYGIRNEPMSMFRNIISAEEKAGE